MDPRVASLAKILVHYSLKLKKGQLFKIQGSVEALPLIKAVFAEAVKVGAHPYTQIVVEDNQEVMLKKGNDKQLSYIPPMNKVEINKIDALLSIWGGGNTRYLSGVDPKRQSLQRTSGRPLWEKLFKRISEKDLSWCGTQFPTQSDAQDADMSLADYEDFVYGAGHVMLKDPVKHWLKVAKEQARLIKILNRVRNIHVEAKGTDLKMCVKGRKWINCAGTENFPDGEVFTSPIENSVEGVIEYSFPAVYMGREVENVRLEFKKGKVVSESADKNIEFLREMLNMDRGARYVGEFAIGTNYQIKQFSRNILFDEKIGGTCHVAVGASIPESGGKNKSSLHWDMVCDLKKNSKITADGRVIYRNGKFLI